MPATVPIRLKICLRSRFEINVRLTGGLLLGLARPLSHLNVRKFPFLGTEAVVHRGCAACVLQVRRGRDLILAFISKAPASPSKDQVEKNQNKNEAKSATAIVAYAGAHIVAAAAKEQ